MAYGVLLSEYALRTRSLRSALGTDEAFMQILRLVTV